MEKLKAGFSRLDITPPLGVFVDGYYNDRFADGILDPLEANCVAVSDGEKTAVLLSIDICEVYQVDMDKFRHKVAEENGIDYEAVYVHCTHTHTGPATDKKGDPGYLDMLGRKLSDAARLAVQDLKPVTVSIGRGAVPGVSFERRFRMKDGAIRTNPGVGNPDIAESIGTPDESLQLVQLSREHASDILLVNFQVHPDTIGGCKISADYPRFVRETLERAIPHVKAVYFNGAQGDLNHVNVNAKEGDLKGLETDSFDDVARGYAHAQWMGRAIAGGVLQVYGKTKDVPGGKVFFKQEIVDIPSNRPDPSQIPEAARIMKLHTEGRDAELPYEGMELTTVVAEAQRMMNLEHGPENFQVYVSSVGFGSVAFLGVAGEPFTDVGRLLKKGSPFEMTIPCCLTNGAEGYYPMKEAYEEGGYEARSSKFRAGVAETLAEAGIGLLKTEYESIK